MTHGGLQLGAFGQPKARSNESCELRLRPSVRCRTLCSEATPLFAQRAALASACRSRRCRTPATPPEKIGSLREVCASVGASDTGIVDRHATLWSLRMEQLQIASDGALIEQQWEFTTRPQVCSLTFRHRCASEPRGDPGCGLERPGLSRGSPIVRIQVERTGILRGDNCRSG